MYLSNAAFKSRLRIYHCETVLSAAYEYRRLRLRTELCYNLYLYFNSYEHFVQPYNDLKINKSKALFYASWSGLVILKHPEITNYIFRTLVIVHDILTSGSSFYCKEGLTPA